MMLLVHPFYVRSEAQPTDIVWENVVDVYIWEVAREFDLSPYLLASLIYQESRFIVKDNLTQIMNGGKWHKEGLKHCGSDDLTNEYVNIRCCGYYLHKWAQEYPNEPHRWLRMWNEGNVNDFNSSYYSRSILKRAEKWEEEQIIFFTEEVN